VSYRSKHLIRSAKQLSALASSSRQEIVDVLAEMGSISVAELAAALGRPADALYFHLRALKKAGLVKHAGYRSRGGRKEELLRTVAPELWLHYDPRNQSNRDKVTAIVASMLRLGLRDFRRAFHESVAVSGEHRELWALRKTGRLSHAQIANVNRSIANLKRSVSNPHGDGRLFAITVILTPLDRRRSPRRSSTLKVPKK
jgi:DNA-binding transcriptional ArsR family regulator